jgi:hypothetical protein
MPDGAGRTEAPEGAAEKAGPRGGNPPPALPVGRS